MNPQRLPPVRGLFRQELQRKRQAIYASKAFSCKEIYRIVLSEGLDVEVVSGGELYTALQAGVPGSQIHFQGNNKSAGELTMAVENGVGDIVVDNLLELSMLQQAAKEHGVRAGISLRVKPGIDAHTHEFIRTGQVDSKFGLDLQNGEALEAVKQALARKTWSCGGCTATSAPRSWRRSPSSMPPR